VRLAGGVEAGSVVISVQDTGTGIAQDQIASLFETFGSSARETASNYGEDVRLGLPLAYRYCRLMGGEISVQSRLGRGSRFVVRLPNRLPGVSEPAALPAEPELKAA
jgi:signal transduction histidine kinase